jgi:hypothetical protein
MAESLPSGNGLLAIARTDLTSNPLSCAPQRSAHSPSTHCSRPRHDQEVSIATSTRSKQRTSRGSTRCAPCSTAWWIKTKTQRPATSASSHSTRRQLTPKTVYRPSPREHCGKRGPYPRRGATPPSHAQSSVCTCQVLPSKQSTSGPSPCPSSTPLLRCHAGCPLSPASSDERSHEIPDAHAESVWSPPLSNP